MRTSAISFCVYICVLFATLFGVVSAGASPRPSPRPSGSHHPTPKPTPTPTPPLCKKNPVQCCVSTAESNSTAASSVLGRLKVDVPKKPVEIGINCTSISDEDVFGGFCDNSILCCRKLFNETIHDGKNITVGFNCTDVVLPH